MSLKPDDVPDEWEFYLCRVDDAPASISLNLWYRAQAPLPDAPAVYWAALAMHEPEEHGMGGGADAEQLHDLEDDITEHAQQQGLFYVGRLRNHGRWQMAFYGAADQEPALRRALDAVELDSRDCFIGSEHDPDWRYYFDFLCPDDERWQWIMDRRVVDKLLSEGDSLQEPRRVDHWAYFDTETARQAFAHAAKQHGFEIEQQMASGEQADKDFGIQIHRVDSVELEDIHDVVSLLKQLAESDGHGDYDGWETSVERA